MPDAAILLLGANGQVGHELQRTLPLLGRLVALDMPDTDFGKPDTLRSVVRKIGPQIIVNAAAYTAVDKAESEQDLAFAVNATAPGVLADEAASLGACLVHYSTDYVFDGSKAGPYVETDTPSPLSVYGRSKLGGDRAVGRSPKHLIFRTSWVISAHGHNFIKTILELARQRDSLRVVADQFGAPTSGALLADVATQVLAHVTGAGENDVRWGLYNVAPSGETSWHGLARHVVARAVTNGQVLKLQPENIAPISAAEYPTAAARPRNSRLSSTVGDAPSRSRRNPRYRSRTTR